MADPALPDGFTLIQETPPLPEGFSLIQEQQQGNPARDMAKSDVRQANDGASQFLPGALAKKYLPEALNKGIGFDVVGPVIDKALGAYHSYVMGAAQGVPVAGAYLDEAIAGISSLTGGDYDDSLNRARAMFEVAADNNPGLNVAGQLVSGLGTGVGVGGALVKGGQTALGAITKGGAINAAAGALHGYGLGEGVNDRVDQAKTGGVIGGVLGAGVPAITTAAGPAIKKGAETFGRAFDEITSGPDEAAMNILVKNIKKSGDTVDTIANDLNKGQTVSRRFDSNSFADLNEAIADTTNPLQDLTATVKRAGGEASDIVTDFVQKRQIGPSNPYAKVPDTKFKGQFAEIRDAFDRALNIKTSNNARRTRINLIQSQKEEGQLLYNKAYKEAEEFDISDTLVGTIEQAQIYSGKINASLSKAVKLFMRGKKGERYPVNNLRLFDASKQELDDMIGKARGNQKRELVQFKHRLLDDVHGADGSRNVVYKEARDSWGSAAERQEALELGENAFQNDSQDIVEKFKTLTQGEKKLFLIGMRDSMRKVFARKRPGNDATLLFQENRAREILNEVIPESKGNGVFNNRPERFGDYMDRQGRMARTRSKVVGGSPTAERLNQDAELALDTMRTVGQRIRNAGGLTPLIAEAIGDLGNKIFGMRHETAVRLAKMLTEADPARQAEILDQVRRKAGSDALNQFLLGLDKASLAASLGTSTTINNELSSE